MKRRTAQWAPLFLLCLAFVVAPGAKAANTASAVRTFTRVVPKDPVIQAMIAKRNEEAAKLHKGQVGDLRQNLLIPRPAMGRSEFPASKRSSAQTSNSRTNASLANRPTESLITRFERQLKAQNSSTERVPHASVAALGGTTPNPTFGGFLTPQEHDLLDPNVDDVIVAMVAVDVNKDGHPDLVSVGYRGDLYVQLNDGKGGFGPSMINTGGRTYNIGFSNPPDYITPADVNGDGLIDLVVTQFGGFSNTVAYPPELLVYLNQGNGRFSDPIVVHPTLSVNERPGAVIVNDRDGDGKADITLLSYLENDKTFDPYQRNPTSYDTSINVQTLYGNGDGTFQNSGNMSQYLFAGYIGQVPNAGAQFVTLAGTSYLAVEVEAYAWAYDPNYDGSTEQLQGTSVLFFQDGTGSRSSQPVANAPSKEINIASNYIYAGSYQSGLSLADVNGDGLPDVTLSFNDTVLYGAKGTSDGGFATPEVIESGRFDFEGWNWVLADVNGDGYLDMITMGFADIEVWLGNGDGTFADPNAFSVNDVTRTGMWGNDPGQLLAAADLDGDGNIDLWTGVWFNTATSILKGNSDGTFAAEPMITLLPPTPGYEPYGALMNTVADLNGDGFSDVVFFDPAGYLGVAISDGKGHLAVNPHVLPPGENGVDYVGGFAAVGDFNNDGYQDVLLNGIRGYTLDLAAVLSKGNGTFEYPVPLNTGISREFPRASFIADINHDGIPDIVNAYCGNSGSTPPGILVLLGNGDGTFQNQPFVQFGQCLNSAALADVNSDGNLDLVVGDLYTGEMTALLGNGAGTFDTSAPISIASGLPAYKIVAFDANNDGHIDLAVLNNSFYGAPMSGVSILIGAGDGTFTLTNTLQIGIGDEGQDMVVADFNGDGCADIFVGGQGFVWGPGAFGAFLNLGNCDGTFGGQQPVFVPGYGPQNLRVGTFTPDGKPSIVGVTSQGYPSLILYNQTGTKVSLTTSENSITAGNSVSLAVSIEASFAHRPVPTGTVSFYDGGTLLGTQSVIAGSASLATSSLAIGSHPITVRYSGDDNFSPQGGNAVNVAVAAPPPVQTPPEIAISSPVPSMVLNRGESKTAALTISGSSNYIGNVTFTVSGATGGLGVTLNPTTVSLTNGGSATVAVSVTTTKNTSTAMATPMRWLGTTFGATAFGVFFVGLSTRKRKSLMVCLLIVLCMVGLCLVSTSCGGSSNNSHYAQTGTSTIVVTATPSVSGASVRTTTFTVTVQ